MKLWLFLALLGCVACFNIAPRIIGGTQVMPGSFPDIVWQAGLIIDGTSLCGGAIIDPFHIVTAAHCFKDINTEIVTDPRTTQVRTGTNINVFQTFAGHSLWIHPNYNSANLVTNSAIDLAVLRINQPIGFSTTVQPIALPQGGPIIPPVGDFIVSGYGTTVSDMNGQSMISPDLLYVNVPYVDYATCNAAAPFTVETTAICAGGVAGKDSCQGDSGGPLVVNIGDMASPSWVLAGVVSTGTRVSNPLCGVANEFGVYTDVQKNINFINQVLVGELPPTAGIAGRLTGISLLLVATICILF